MIFARIAFSLFLIFIPGAQGHSNLESLKIDKDGKARIFSASFSSPVEGGFSRFSLESKQLSLSLIPLNFEKRGKVQRLRASVLEPGSYVFRWTILSADGHRQEGGRKVHID